MLKIEYVKTADLIPYANNPRKNDAAVDKVVESIREFGFKNPIIVDGNNEIIAGHTRLKAAEKLGIDKVPTIRAEDLTPEQVKAFRIADNKTHEFAGWDMDLLREELDGVNLFTGFDEDELREILDNVKFSEVEEDDFDLTPPEEPKSKLGDIYQLGRHRLMCGDSTDRKTVERLMAGVKADMVFTDPPWNVNYGAVKEDNEMGYKPRTILNDFMGTEEFKAFMMGAFACMNKASKPGAMTYVVMSAQEWGNLMLCLARNDYHWSSTIIWNKDHLVMSRKDYHTKYEPIWYGWKAGEARICPLEDRKQSDVWDIDRPTKSEEHPTMKPVELVARAMTNSSKAGSVALDLFGGSGATLIAAEQTGRTCHMMELDPKYIDVIINRWEQFTGQKAVRLNG